MKQDFLPRVVKVNGKRCAIGLKPNITAAVPLPLQGNTESRIEAQDGHVSISGNRLVGVDGNLLTLRGANWFGFETEVQITSLIDYEDPYTRQLHCPSPTASLQVVTSLLCYVPISLLAFPSFMPSLLVFPVLKVLLDLLQATMVDGFWGGSETLRGDFATVAYRMQLLGFNAIRLPFSFLVSIAIACNETCLTMQAVLCGMLAADDHLAGFGSAYAYSNILSMCSLAQFEDQSKR